MWIQGRLPGDLSVRSICTFCCRIMTAADYGLQNANNWISQFLRILWDKSLSSGCSSREEIISWGTAFWIMGPFSCALSTLSLLKILKLTEKTIPATERQTPNTHREVWPIFCSVFQRTAGCSSNKSPHLQSKLSLFLFLPLNVRASLCQDAQNGTQNARCRQTNTEQNASF